MAPNIFLTVCFVVGLGGGVAVLRFPHQIARFFRKGAAPLFPDELVRRTYTARNALWGGWGFVLFGTVALVILVWRLLNGYGL